MTTLVISRKQQDDFAIESYNKAAHASNNGLFEKEIVPISIPQRKGGSLEVKEDEEFKNVRQNWNLLALGRTEFHREYRCSM